MSLSIALQNAISGLNVNARALDVTAQNVSNVNTEGYSRKDIKQKAVVIAGQGAGVEIASISRTVNEFMMKELRTATSRLGEVQAKDDFYARMQDLFGTLRSDTSPSAGLTELATTFQALADTPENVSLRTDLVERAKLLAQQFNDIATKIESFRVEIDRAIEDGVAEINTQLASVQELNIKIAENIALKQGVSELQDQRDIALGKIAEQIDIQQFTRSNGEVVVLTKTGRALVDRTAQTLTHDAVSSGDPLITWAAGSIDGITLAGSDITSEIGTGRIAGLVALRDTILPDLHSQFQELVTALHDEINALHNQGTAYPGLPSVTGTRTLAAADTPAWTGTFRVTVTDTGGKAVESQDFNLASYATVGALVTAIDGMTNLAASIDAAGKVVITPTGNNRVAFNEMTSAATVGSRTLGASNFLGLNDFFTSANEYDDYSSSYRGSRTAALGLSGTLTFRGAFGTTTVGYGSGDSLNSLATAINANATLGGAGISAAVVTDGSGFRLRINDSGNDNFFVTDSSNLVSTLNIRARDTSVVKQLAVRADIVTDPSRISRGKLTSAAIAVGDVVLGAGDKTVVQQIADRFNAKLTFDATNLLAASSTTFSQYSAEILSLNATQAKAAADGVTSRDILFQNLKAKTASISGVNLDEEMSRMIVLQNAYAASARVINTTQTLFDLLSDLVR